MKKNILFTVILAGFFAFNGCNSGGDDVESMQKQLSEYRSQQEELNFKIAELEQKINAKDPDALETETGKLVSVQPVVEGAFSHYIDLQGTVQSRENIMVSSDVMGASVQINVREGEQVKKGQQLIKLDDATLIRNIAELETNLELANNLYTRQENLWKQNIGSEVQYLEAKNRKESLENRLQSARTQMAKTTVRSPIDGVVDEVFIRIGEMASPGSPLVRVVNNDEVRIVASASEAYVGKVKTGDSVIINVPSMGINQPARVTAVGQIINPNNRTFNVEVSMQNPQNQLKPNQLAIIKVSDYSQSSAIIIPTKYIQHSNQGQYVFVAKAGSDGQMVAEKKNVTTGRTFEGETEIVEGLTGAEQLITAGYRDVIDGEPIRIHTENDNSLGKAGL